MIFFECFHGPKNFPIFITVIVCVVLITTPVFSYFSLELLDLGIYLVTGKQTKPKNEGTKFILVMKVTLNHIIWAMLVGGSSTLVAGMCMQLSNP